MIKFKARSFFRGLCKNKKRLMMVAVFCVSPVVGSDSNNSRILKRDKQEIFDDLSEYVAAGQGMYRTENAWQAIEMIDWTDESILRIEVPFCII